MLGYILVLLAVVGSYTLLGFLLIRRSGVSVYTLFLMLGGMVLP